MRSNWNYKNQLLNHALSAMLVTLPQLANAADGPESNYTVSGQAAFVSDYIWRGLSQTWGEPAIQVAISGDHVSGAYANFFASNVSSQFVPGATIETDFGAGYKFHGAGAEWDIGAVYVFYPGSNYNKASVSPKFRSSDPKTLELYLGITKQSINLRMGYIPTEFYGWNTNNSGVYGVFNSEHPDSGLTGSSKGAVNVEGTYTYLANSRITFLTTLGYEDIPNSHDINWGYARLTLSYAFAPEWAISTSLSATTNPDAFESYSSLTGNAEQSTPSRRTVIISVTKQL